MRETLKITALLSVAFFLIVFPALADRTTIRPARNLFTQQQDVEMGRILAGEAERTFQLIDDRDTQAYIDALGRQLTNRTTGFRYPYRFKIVSDSAINAWALPGGSIYITSGLVQAAQNEPQLAGALAHQIAHVALRHGTAEVTQAYDELSSNSTGRSTSVNDALSRLNIRFEPDAIPLRYTREEERQADVFATQILYDAAFDPRPMSQLLQTIAEDRTNRTADFFSAHPELANPATIVRTELRNLGGVPRNLRADNPDFRTVKDRVARNADNLPTYPDRNRIGDRPELPSTRTVLFRGQDIEVRHPDNWYVSETRDAVYIAPEGGLVSGSLAYGMSISFFDPQNNYFGRNSLTTPQTRVDSTSLAGATNELIDHLRDSNPNMRVVRDTERRRVDGSPAMVVELSNESPLGGKETDWLVTVMRPNGRLRYFVGVAPQNEFSRYQSAFEEIVDSARLLD